MAATARQCAITLLPNNVEMCFLCLHMFLTPWKPIRGHYNIYYQYFTKLWGGGGRTNVAPGKRHIVVQCNNLCNKAIISHSEAEGNQRNVEHFVKMFRLLTKNIL